MHSPWSVYESGPVRSVHSFHTVREDDRSRFSLSCYYTFRPPLHPVSRWVSKGVLPIDED